MSIDANSAGANVFFLNPIHTQGVLLGCITPQTVKPTPCEQLYEILYGKMTIL